MTPELTKRPGTVAAILTEAFAGDPFMSWVFDQPDSHVPALAAWWRFITENRPQGAELWLADDESSAAVWYPPRLPKDTADGTEAVDGADTAPAAASEYGDQDEPDDPFIEMMAGLVGVRLPEVLAMFGQVVEAHPEEPHWYLAAVGTRAAAQGQGSGRRLLEPVLARCDEQGLAAYLESSNPRNVPFYHRQGFELVGKLLTPDESATMTLMSRRPR